jgi:hypothetical protein
MALLLLVMAGGALAWFVFSMTPTPEGTTLSGPVVVVREQTQPAPPIGQGPAPAPNGPDDAVPGRPPFAVDKKLLSPERVVYLTDMEEFDVKIGPWPLGKGDIGDSVRTPVVVNGKAYPKGLGMHPPSAPAFARARYALGRKAQVFKTGIAFNDHNVPGLGPVTFLVFGDGKLLWHSKQLQARQQVEEASVDVGEVNVLELRVQPVGGTWGSHAVWVEPRLFKKRADSSKETP